MLMGFNLYLEIKNQITQHPCFADPVFQSIERFNFWQLLEGSIHHCFFVFLNNQTW